MGLAGDVDHPVPPQKRGTCELQGVGRQHPAISSALSPSGIWAISAMIPSQLGVPAAAASPSRPAAVAVAAASLAVAMSSGISSHSAVGEVRS